MLGIRPLDRREATTFSELWPDLYSLTLATGSSFPMVGTQIKIGQLGYSHSLDMCSCWATTLVYHRRRDPTGDGQIWSGGYWMAEPELWELHP